MGLFSWSFKSLGTFISKLRGVGEGLWTSSCRNAAALCEGAVHKFSGTFSSLGKAPGSFKCQKAFPICGFLVKLFLEAVYNDLPAFLRGGGDQERHRRRRQAQKTRRVSEPGQFFRISPQAPGNVGRHCYVMRAQFSQETRICLFMVFI